MDESAGLHDQLLATKFFIPSSPHALILRPRLLTLLTKSLEFPLTLVSAPADFGKTTLIYLLEHLPPQLHLILATRADPPIPLSLLRARGHLLEIRTDELRCSLDEVMAFLEKASKIHLSQDMVEEVTTRTEGWLVGLQLFVLSLQGHTDPGYLLEEVSGSQRYIFDYLIDEVFQHQSAAVQTFLLQTSVLKQLSAPLCDAILEQSGSQPLPTESRS